VVRSRYAVVSTVNVVSWRTDLLAFVDLAVRRAIAASATTEQRCGFGWHGTRACIRPTLKISFPHVVYAAVYHSQ
jgi:hypothetical protein